MSTVVASALPTRVDLATWDEDVSGRDDAYELVEGVPTMTPAESLRNRAAGTLLAGALNAAREGWIAVTDAELTVSEVLDTVRRPDVVVVRSALARDRAGKPEHRLLAREVLFVAEVVSPSSVERDLVTKRREYALAGIPSYLIVDLRYEPGELTLYADRDGAGLFVNVEPALRVDILVAGRAIPVTVADLLG